MRKQRLTRTQKIGELVCSARKRAQKRGLPFEITARFVAELWRQQQGRCFYTGERMKLVSTHQGRYMQDPQSPSLDRRIPSGGYVPENVALCVFWFNIMKSTGDLKFLVRKAKVILRASKKFGSALI